MGLDDLPELPTQEELESRTPQVGDPIQFGIEEAFVDSVDGETITVYDQTFRIDQLVATTSTMKGCGTWKVESGSGQTQFPHWAQ